MATYSCMKTIRIAVFIAILTGSLLAVPGKELTLCKCQKDSPSKAPYQLRYTKGRYNGPGCYGTPQSLPSPGRSPVAAPKVVAPQAIAATFEPAHFELLQGQVSNKPLHPFQGPAKLAIYCHVQKDGKKWESLVQTLTAQENAQLKAGQSANFYWNEFRQAPSGHYVARLIVPNVPTAEIQFDLK